VQYNDGIQHCCVVDHEGGYDGPEPIYVGPATQDVRSLLVLKDLYHAENRGNLMTYNELKDAKQHTTTFSS
jgi:hypothetical protein